MAATVQVQVFHGAGPTGSDVTSATIRMKRADDDAQDANDPVPRPSSGVNYSWVKWLKLVATVLPDNRLSNLRFFSNGASLGTGRTLLFAREATYAQATSADEAGPISADNVDSVTSASPEVVQAGTFVTNADSLPATGGALQDYIQLQLAIDSTAVPGNSATSKVLTYRFDEA